MNAADQAHLVRDFMMAIAPEMARHSLGRIAKAIDREYLAAAGGTGEVPDDEHLSLLRTHAAADNARMTVEWAIHLAAQCAQVYDTFHAETTHQVNPKDPLKTRLQAYSKLEREAAGADKSLQ